LRAFEVLLSLYEKQIFSYVLRLVRHREDAEDLTQTTFIKCHRSIAQVDPEKNVRAWVYRIATNVVHDWWRSRKHEPAWFDPAEDDGIAVETNEAADTYYSVEKRHDLDIALSALKPMHRTVLLLYYQQGLSYQEIAESLTVPINTVKTHISRAKQALKKELHDSYG
jgi:RNA polymerase sigma-70 factor (ECF subfamily)